MGEIKNIDDKCIILHNSSENYLVGSLSIDDYNRLLKQIANNYAIEYILIPVSKSSHVYIATHRELLPEYFEPVDIEYNVTLQRFSHHIELLMSDSINPAMFDSINPGSYAHDSFIMDRTYKVRCNTFFEYQIFLFSMVKMMAYNVITNISAFRPRDMALFDYGDDRYHYTFNISSVSIYRNAKRIFDTHNNAGIGEVIDAIQKAMTIKSAYADMRVLPCIYNFWIGYNGRCSYNSWRKPKQMEGVINKVNHKCLISHACNNYNSYAFVSSTDEVILNALDHGEMNIVVYNVMGDHDSLVTDGPPTMYDLLNNPELIAIHKIEKYDLYTTSDYVEALVFASDMMDMIKLVFDLMGDEYSNCQILMEIRTNSLGSNNTFAYTVTKEQLDLGEITSVFDDFIKLLDPYLDHNIPF